MGTRKRGTRIIAMAATKGGVGKTTLSAALAVRAAEDSKRVALLDRDPQESLGSWWDRRGKPENPKLFEVDSAPEAIGLIAAEGWEWIFCDTPPAIFDLIEQSIGLADFVLIPARASALDILAVDPVAEVCRESGKPFAFVLNAVDHRSKLTKTAAAYLGKLGPVLETQIAQRVAYVAAMTVGKVGFEVERDGQARREIDALWLEIKGIVNTPARAKS